MSQNCEASRGAGAQPAQVCDCKRDKLWVRFPPYEMEYLRFSLLRSGAKIEN